MEGERKSACRARWYKRNKEEEGGKIRWEEGSAETIFVVVEWEDKKQRGFRMSENLFRFVLRRGCGQNDAPWTVFSIFVLWCAENITPATPNKNSFVPHLTGEPWKGRHWADSRMSHDQQMSSIFLALPEFLKLETDMMMNNVERLKSNAPTASPVGIVSL